MAYTSASKLTSFFSKVQELESVTQFSKHEQIVQGVINAINDKVLVQGNMLPSVNAMVKQLGFSSKTIQKAYRELKERGLIESKNRLGYFVVNVDVGQTFKVALLMYAFHPIQEAFYNSFRSALGDTVQVDVFFHHSNIDVFETILGNIKGQYGMYVVAPIPHPKIKEILDLIPSEKLLLVDRFESLKEQCSHVTQEFQNATYHALIQLHSAIKNFKRIVLFFREDADHPIGIRDGFRQYVHEFQLNGEILPSYVSDSIEEGTVYFTIADGDLWGILKDAKAQKINIGKDIGVLSNSEDPVKEIVCDGITTNSIDFHAMGQLAAEYVLNREPVFITIPTILTRRNSL